MISAALFSSVKEDWGTPQWLFDACDRVFKFTLDAAASRENALCTEYFTKEDNSLIQEWHESTFVNPPYGRRITGEFVAVAFRQAFFGDKTSVLLLPARTDVRWFHEFIYELPRVSHRFIRGRLKFRGAKSGAPFPSTLDEARAEASRGQPWPAVATSYWRPECTLQGSSVGTRFKNSNPLSLESPQVAAS